ncbi:MAG: transglutaminase domain-containing protein [Gammaproteobacteria bacterium]|nr:transglutaminase domain-containing protein [Gammaproteobacteria bacterium]
MLLRLSAGVLALALTLAFADWLAQARPAEAERADALAGAYWYQLSMGSAPIGYLATEAGRDWRGAWRFQSFMLFSVDGGAPVSISESLTFDPLPPYRLTRAEHWSDGSGSPTEGVVLEWSADGGRAKFKRGDAVRERSIDWAFSLGDYLALESWLAAEQPQSGARFRVRSLDFNAAKLVNKPFRVLERNEIGYRFASPAPLRATEIQLDSRYVPVAFSMSGLFSLTRATQGEALKVRPPLHLTNHRVALDRGLPNHGQIERLVLIAEDAQGLNAIWPEARRGLGGWRLEIEANPVTAADSAAFLGETLQFPVHHQQVARLANQGVGSAETDEDRLAALVAFVHAYVDYRPDAPPASVLETIDRRTGDCTEYADLLTTLARALGWPARTVIGLAYSGGNEPALAFHAWNEVALGGSWHAVDPTWNQLRADASHIPLRGDATALLRLMQGDDGLRFRVAEVRYASRD